MALAHIIDYRFPLTRLRPWCCTSVQIKPPPPSSARALIKPLSIAARKCREPQARADQSVAAAESGNLAPTFSRVERQIATSKVHPISLSEACHRALPPRRGGSRELPLRLVLVGRNWPLGTFRSEYRYTYKKALQPAFDEVAGLKNAGRQSVHVYVKSSP